jgi:hypothetical protein
MTLLLVIAAGVQAYPSFRKAENVGERIRQECEAIVSEISDLETLRPDSRRELVVKCLLESAVRGRR